MTTFYYIAYSIKKKDNTIARLASMHFDNVEDARALYEVKIKKSNVICANLYLVDVYKPEEMTRPEVYPGSRTYSRTLATYSRV